MKRDIKNILKILFRYSTDNTDDKPSSEILPCLKNISSFLKRKRVYCGLQEYKVFSEDDQPMIHANLLAFNPELKGPFVLFQGHIDTVPFIPPYNFELRSNTLKGRGAVDMKGSLAGMISAFIDLYKKSKSFKYPPMLLITGDEEACAFAGIKTFLERNRLPIFLAINGESTNFKVGTKFLGVLAYNLERKGKGGHSSSIDNDYLIEKLIPTLESINDFLAKSRKVFDKSFGKTIGAFTVVKSGKKDNQLPEDFRASWNLRTVKDRGVYDKIFKDTIEKRIDVKTKIKSFCYEPTKIDIPMGIKKALKYAFEKTGIGYKESAVNFFTEASLINQIGILTVVCGPGNPTLAHVEPKKEVIKINNIVKYSKLLQNIVKEFNKRLND